MRLALALLVVVTAAPAALAESRASLEAGAIVPDPLIAGDWETVRWTWSENETHGLAPDDGGPLWCEPRAGGCSRAFPEPGEYRYHCPLHPEMRGVVIIERRGGDPGGAARAVFAVRQSGLVVTFDASRSAQSRVAIESYEWSFGDNVSAMGRVVEHAYAQPGVYIARLTVVDEFGNEAHATRRVEVLPGSDAAAAFRVAVAGHTVVVDAPPVEGKHDWQFGDGPQGANGTIEMGPGSLVHTYLRGGEYQITHTLDAGGSRASAVAPVSVPADAMFRVESDGLRVVVDASALPTYANATYAWLFGDLERANGSRVEHAFPLAGRWSIELTIADDAGAQRIEEEVPLTNATTAAFDPLTLAARPEESTRDTPASPLLLIVAALAVARMLRPETYK